MSKVTAIGRMYGVYTEVEVSLEDGKPIIKVDGYPDEYWQRQFDELLDRAPPMGGTYYPPMHSLLAVYNVVKNALFDEQPEIAVEGELEQIPFEKGKVY